MPIHNTNKIQSSSPSQPRKTTNSAVKPSLQDAVVDLLEDPITFKPMFNPVLLDDGRILDSKTVEKMRQQDPQKRYISPYTREVMSKPKPMPQLQAVVEAVYGDEIRSQEIRRRKLAALVPPPLPKVVPFELDKLSLEEADNVVRHVRANRDTGVDLARVDAGVFIAGGVVEQAKLAEAIVELLTQHGCVDPKSLHVLPKVTASKVELVLRKRVAAWYTGSGTLSKTQRIKALSCVKLAIAEAARVAENKHAFVRATDRVKRAEASRLPVAIGPLKERQKELLQAALRLPSEINPAAKNA